ncbi:MAG: Rrf2 family transcriptional regulator [Methyloceanibacter sp.]|nr:Rrf2 family transcriptional regulator [Methyloceanibacter sp.]
MRLTLHTDYSLRVLMYLAVFPDRLSTAEQIAAAYGVSHNHITKVVQTLARLGLVETLRGRNGGIRLAKRPEQISVGAVVRATEEDFDLVECFRSKTSCAISPACRLQGALRDALAAYLDVLDDWTLSDIAANRSGLARRLGAH